MPVTIGAVTAGIGLVQGAVGYFGAKKARKQLEGLQSPTYSPAKSISDYYSEAKQRYNTSPYASTLYNTQLQNINRNTNQGLAGLQSRRLGIGGVSSLIQGQNDAMLKAAGAAEQQRDQRFGQYGQAANAMAGEERQAFNINKMMPYERKYNLLAMKAQANNQLMNAGIQNIAGGATTAAMGSSGLSGMSGMKNSGSGLGDAGYDQGRYLPPSTRRIPLAQY